MLATVIYIWLSIIIKNHFKYKYSLIQSIIMKTLLKFLSVVFALLFSFEGYSQSCGLCTGVTQRTMTANPTGQTPFTYSWSGGGTAQTKTVSTAGTYTVTVTDGNGCTATNSFVIPSLTPPNATLVATNGTCGNLGSINNTVTSGQSPYTYLWSNGATTEDLANLASGTYTVTVTDANGCQNVKSATITNTSAASVTISCN